MAFLKSKPFLLGLFLALSYAALLLSETDARRATMLFIPYAFFMSAVVIATNRVKDGPREITISLNEKLAKRVDLMFINSGLPDRKAMLREMFSTYEFYVDRRSRGEAMYTGNADDPTAGTLTRFIPPAVGDEREPADYDSVDQLFADVFRQPPRSNPPRAQ